MPITLPIALQLAAARRELSLRRNTYPKWVAAGRMPQARADHEIEAMAAIVATLEKLTYLEQASHDLIKCQSRKPNS